MFLQVKKIKISTKTVCESFCKSFIPEDEDEEALDKALVLPVKNRWRRLPIELRLDHNRVNPCYDLEEADDRKAPQ
jgi:hypothetical protein